MKKKVVISCIPILNENQQRGLLKLIQSLESQDQDIYLWTDSRYELLKEYQFSDPHARKTYSIEIIRKLLKYLKIKLFIDDAKWNKRLAVWSSVDSRKKTRQLLNNYIRSSLKIFTRLQPDVFICWNPFCCHYGIAYDVALILGIKSKAIEWGYLPDTFLLDNNGTLAKSEIYVSNPLLNFKKEELDHFKKEGEEIFDNLKNQSLSLYNQASLDLPTDLLKKKDKHIRILVLAIDEVDAGAIPIEHKDRLGLLPFHTSSFDQAQAIAKASPEYQVIFKPHPSHNKFKENQQVNANLWIINGNPDPLIDWADVVFSSGSKMEFSVLLRNKPLINFGAGLLYGKECAYEVTRRDDLTLIVNQALEKKDFDSKIISFKTFLGFLKKEYLFSY